MGLLLDVVTGDGVLVLEDDELVLVLEEETDVDDVVWTVEAEDVSVAVDVELELELVVLVLSRLASCTMELATAASSRCTASSA